MKHIPTLKDTQQLVQNYLLSSDKRIQEHIVGQDLSFVRKRLAIYGISYQVRMVDVLKLNFPSLNKLLGESKFENVAREYLSHYPSRSFDLGNFGNLLHQFLITKKTYSEHSLPAEMVKFEWALHSASIARGVPTINLEKKLKAVKKNGKVFCLKLHPSVSVIELKWNVPDLWEAYQKEQSLSPMMEPLHLITWVIGRKKNQVYYCSTNFLEAKLIQMIIQSKPIISLLEEIYLLMSTLDAESYLIKFLK